LDCFRKKEKERKGLGKELHIQLKKFRKYEKTPRNHILFYLPELIPDNILVYFLQA